MKIMISGGAPLSSEVKHFLTVVFSAPIFECYGIAEAAGFISCSSLWDWKGGNVGGILSCNKM